MTTSNSVSTHAMRVEALRSLLKISYPIVQAPMGRSAPPELAAAVSNSGALGTLGVSWTPPDRIANLVERYMNIAGQRSLVLNFCNEWDQSERVAASLDTNASILSFFWGINSKLLRQAKTSGRVVMQTVRNVDEARSAVDEGADVLVAQGWEAGGHVWSETSTLVLIPSICDAAPNIPVIAAGGIADGRGLAAVLCLGASGAWIGTRFLCADESLAHDQLKKRLMQAKAGDTVVTQLFSGGWPDAPHRVLRNSTFLNWEGSGSPTKSSRLQEGKIIGIRPDGSKVNMYDFDGATSDIQGEWEAFALYAGQSVELVRACEPAADIVRDIVHGADKILPQAQLAINSEVC
jgi:nitronate monooxygenase